MGKPSLGLIVKFEQNGVQYLVVSLKSTPFGRGIMLIHAVVKALHPNMLVAVKLYVPLIDRLLACNNTSLSVDAKLYGPFQT